MALEHITEPEHISALERHMDNLAADYNHRDTKTRMGTPTAR